MRDRSIITAYLGRYRIRFLAPVWHLSNKIIYTCKVMHWTWNHADTDWPLISSKACQEHISCILTSELAYSAIRCQWIPWKLCYTANVILIEWLGRNGRDHWIFGSVGSIVQTALWYQLPGILPLESYLIGSDKVVDKSKLEHVLVLSSGGSLAQNPDKAADGHRAVNAARSMHPPVALVDPFSCHGWKYDPISRSFQRFGQCLKIMIIICNLVWAGFQVLRWLSLEIQMRKLRCTGIDLKLLNRGFFDIQCSQKPDQASQRPALWRQSSAVIIIIIVNFSWHLSYRWTGYPRTAPHVFLECWHSAQRMACTWRIMNHAWSLTWRTRWLTKEFLPRTAWSCWRATTAIRCSMCRWSRCPLRSPGSQQSNLMICIEGSSTQPYRSVFGHFQFDNIQMNDLDMVNPCIKK